MATHSKEECTGNVQMVSVLTHLWVPAASLEWSRSHSVVGFWVFYGEDLSPFRLGRPCHSKGQGAGPGSSSRPIVTPHGRECSAFLEMHSHIFPGNIVKRLGNCDYFFLPLPRALIIRHRVQFAHTLRMSQVNASPLLPKAELYRKQRVG